MIRYLDIGKIVNTHGVKGELKVLPLTDNPQRYSILRDLFIDNNGILEKYSVQSVRYHKGFVLLKLKEIQTMTEAAKFKNKFIKIDRKDAIRLPEDTYFICDIIGLQVFDAFGKELGYIESVFQTGSNDVYVIKPQDKNKKEILIPAIKSVIKHIDIENKRMLVELPEGLLEDEI